MRVPDHYYKNLHQDKSKAETSSWDRVYAKNWSRVLVFSLKNPIYPKANNLHQNSFLHQMESLRNQMKQMNTQKQWIQITLLSEESDRLHQNFLSMLTGVMLLEMLTNTREIDDLEYQEFFS